jgi:hypothetical protein
MSRGRVMTEADAIDHARRHGLALDPALTVRPGPAPAPPKLPRLDRFQSDTERRFATHVLGPWQHDGLIKQWWYAPCKGMYLGPKTSYTPDFLLEPNLHPAWASLLGILGMPRLLYVEVKGKQIWDKDWIKAKQAAVRYSCFCFVLAQWKDERWSYKIIPPY